MHAATDHQVIAIGNDTMHLLDVDGNAVHATARRQGDGWEISADGVDDLTVATRDEAIAQLTEHTLAKLHGHGDESCKTCAQPLTGFSTWVPHGVRALP